MKSLNTSKFIKNFGFTVLEIVIAISVIGILAVIVTVSYSGITNRATESTIKSDLSNALGDFNLYKTEKNKYPTAVDDCPNVDPNKVCIEFSGDNQYEYLVDDATNPASYRLIVTNKDLAYYIEDDFNSPKLLDASVPEFNPIPTAPITYTLTLTAGTGGTVSGGGTFDAGTVRTITATPSTYYSFSSWTGSTGCSGTASHTITMDANKSCTANFTPTAIATPAAPTVSASTAGDTTTWSWGATSCPGNTARYQYEYTNGTGYDSGWVDTANTSVAFTTSTPDIIYVVYARAQCYNPVASSSWSTYGSANYYRPPTAITVTGGTVTTDGSYTVRTFNSSGTLSITNGTLTGVSVLIVGGGCSGAMANTVTGLGGNGGKGGQVVSLSNQSLTGNINITVGSSNQNSTLGASTATGGGGAAGGIPGACVQGVNGANGVQSSISGVATYYGGGGGAGSARGCGGDSSLGGSSYGLGTEGYGAHYWYDYCQGGYIADNGGPGGGYFGKNNGGGGGGGGFSYDGTVLTPGAGGSGVVIIRYLTP